MSDRVSGHTLVSEGAPFERVADRYARVIARRLNDGGVGGRGRALCSCKEMSAPLTSGAARKAWHRKHKNEVASDE